MYLIQYLALRFLRCAHAFASDLAKIGVFQLRYQVRKLLKSMVHGLITSGHIESYVE